MKNLDLFANPTVIEGVIRKYNGSGVYEVEVDGAFLFVAVTDRLTAGDRVLLAAGNGQYRYLRSTGRVGGAVTVRV